MTEYKSSVLTCHDMTATDCAVCEFLNGDQGTEVMLEVIRVLDVNLAKNKESMITLFDSINTLEKKLAEKELMLEMVLKAVGYPRD